MDNNSFLIFSYKSNNGKLSINQTKSSIINQSIMNKDFTYKRIIVAQDDFEF